jgi:lipid kinase YegS
VFEKLLDQDSRRSLCFILNDRAAQNVEIRQYVTDLRAAGHHIDVRAVWENGQPRLFAREAATEGYDVVIAGGGDGTLNEVINGVLQSGRTEVAVGILPFGTANDFATGCGIPLNNVPQAMHVIVTGQPHLVDVGQVNERFFINVASGGFGAEVSTNTPQFLKDLLGGIAYSLTGLVKAFESKTRQVDFRGHKFHWEGDVLLFAIGNGRRAGGGHLVAPKALLNDRLLDVMLVPNMGILEIPTVLEEMLRIGEFDTEYVKSFRTPWLQIEAPEELQVNVDGEPLLARSFRFELLDRPLPMLLPEEAPLKPAARRR